MSDHPSYWQVFVTFARNSLVREMTFRLNFVIECVSSLSWAAMNLGFDPARASVGGRRAVRSRLLLLTHPCTGSITRGTGNGVTLPRHGGAVQTPQFHGLCLTMRIDLLLCAQETVRGDA